MTKSHQELEELAERLARGGDPERAEIVRRAQRFKRSWVELAAGLFALRRSRAYERWGFSELHEYCQKELHLKSATVDKLLLSYHTLETHAPEVLDRDGVEREIPTVDAVDYFGRALHVRDPENDAPVQRRLDAPRAVLDELRRAVFDEGKGVGELRKRFDPILRPKDPRDEELDALRKTRALAERLAEAVQGLDGLSEKRVARVLAMVEALQRDLAQLLEEAAKKSKDKDEAA